MERPICIIIWLLVFLCSLICGEVVNKCCPKGEAMAVDGGCVKRDLDGPWLETIPPPTFSALTDGFVSIQLNASEDEAIECKKGETRRELTLKGVEAEDWLLLVGTGTDRAELYITGDAETLLDFCLEEIQDGGNNAVGTVARFCSDSDTVEESKEQEQGIEEQEIDCLDVICVSVCCPPGTQVKKSSNECETIPVLGDYMFEPPFVDNNQNPVAIEDQSNYKIVHGEPQCDAILTYDGPTNRFVLQT